MTYESGDFLIENVGNGRFQATDNDGTKSVGPSLEGMLRYTYFEDFTIPPDGWQISHLAFFKDYQTKVFKDVQSGRITQDPADGKFRVREEHMPKS